MHNVIRYGILAAALCAALVTSPGLVLAESGSAGGSIGNDEKTLSGSRSEPSSNRDEPRRQSRKAEEPRRSPHGSGGSGSNFDGTWSYTGVATNCQGSASGTLVIAGGLISNKSGTGEVSPNGAYHSASVGDDGVAMTATGRMAGNTGSGSFRRADGCVGRWSARRV
jgi:hypothetical protein